MQNATHWKQLKGADLTTVYLQTKPVELHLMPLCDKTVTTPVCKASGYYVNDDGLTTDLAQRAEYTFVYVHDISTTAGAAPDLMQISIIA